MQRVMPEGISDYSRELLFLLGESLKGPLVALYQLSETNQAPDQVGEHAKRALITIDSVLLYKRLASGQLSLIPEPVHLGSVIRSVAEKSRVVTKSSSNPHLHFARELNTIHADRTLVHSAVQSLYLGLMGSDSSFEQLSIRARNTTKGVYLRIVKKGVPPEGFYAQKVVLNSSQPFASQAGSSVDILSAKGLLSLIGAPLRKVKTHDAYGFGITFLPSTQLGLLEIS